MTWYAASILISTRKINNPGLPISVMENIVLVEASSHEEAACRATEVGKEYAIFDSTLTLDGEAALNQFVGIRKILTIRNLGSDMDQEPPSTGSEISYSEFEVETEEDLQKLADGKEVEVRYFP